MTDLLHRPWHSLYRAVPPTIEPASRPASPCSAPRSRARSRRRARPLLRSRPITVGEIDAMSDALAVALQRRGVEPGDRVAMYLQNMPQVLITVLAAWKCGAVIVPCNPMLRERELVKILSDSGSRVLICQEDLYAEVARAALPVDGRAAHDHHLAARLPPARRRRCRPSWPASRARAIRAPRICCELVARHARRGARRRWTSPATTSRSWSTRRARPARRRRR